MSVTVDHRIAERRRNVKEAGARRRLRVTLVLGSLALLGGLAVWLLQSPYFDVDEVVVTGVDRSAAGAVLERSGVVAGRPTIAIRAGAVVAALEADPWIESARVTVVWPGRVDVDIVEHTPAAWVRSGGGWLVVSAAGDVLAEALAPGDRQPVIDLATAVLRPGDRFADPAVLGAVAFVAALPPDPAESVVVTGDASSLWADVGPWRVRLGRPEYMAEKARSLGALVGAGLEPGSTIDLIAPSRPAVHPPASEGTSTDGSPPAPEGQVEGESQEP